MPIYEYICEQDDTRIELLRPMSEADAPVEDPQSKGRTFKRAMSAPNAKTAGGAGKGVSLGGGAGGSGGCCPCGKTSGGCGGRA